MAILPTGMKTGRLLSVHSFPKLTSWEPQGAFQLFQGAATPASPAFTSLDCIFFSQVNVPRPAESCRWQAGKQATHPTAEQSVIS
jgi:hypothetical protein